MPLELLPVLVPLHQRNNRNQLARRRRTNTLTRLHNMAGGLQGRLLREQVREQQLRNTLMAEQIGRPTGMLEDMSRLEHLAGQSQQRGQQAMMMPFEIEQAVLRNLGLDQVNQRQALELEYLPESLRNQILGQQTEQQLQGLRMQETQGNLEQQEYNRSIRDEDRQENRDYRNSLLDFQRNQGVPSVLSSLGQFADPQELALSYLRARGITGDLRPLPEPLSFMPQNAPAQDAEMRAAILNYLNNQNPQLSD